jgi:hypothetical protein
MRRVANSKVFRPENWGPENIKRSTRGAPILLEACDTGPFIHSYRLRLDATFRGGNSATDASLTKL